MSMRLSIRWLLGNVTFHPICLGISLLLFSSSPVYVEHVDIELYNTSNNLLCYFLCTELSSVIQS